MTPEERRDYQRKWREENRDKVKENEKKQARKKALLALSTVKKISERCYIAVDSNGQEYFLCGGQA